MWQDSGKATKGSLKTVPTDHPSEVMLARVRQNGESLPFAERCAIQQHVQDCQTCQEELAALASFNFSLVQRWENEVTLEQGSVEEQPHSLSRFLVEVTRDGLQLLDQYLTPPFLGAQEILTPIPTYRLRKNPSALTMKIDVGEVEIRATVVQDGGKVALNLTFLDAESRALAGQQVFLRRQRRMVFSAMTTRDGTLRTPHLSPDTYEIACPNLSVIFQLEFRSC